MKLILFLLSLFISSYASATTYAVIVGVEEYDSPKVNNLTASVDDAERVYTFFLQHTAAENLILLRNKEATKANILKAMQRLFAKAKADDMILFYFSGHGSKGAFCPHDISTGALYHTDIRNAFKASHAKTKMCVADACYSGSITTKKPAPTSQKNNNQNVIIFMSSRDNQVSAEARNFTGIFTRFFLLGMMGEADANNDRAITLYELYVYVRKNVTKTHSQVPVMLGKFDKNMKLISY